MDHECVPTPEGWINIENKAKFWRSKCAVCGVYHTVPIAQKPGRTSQRPYTGAWLGKPSLCDAMDRAITKYGRKNG
jgi:hypothetical protein